MFELHHGDCLDILPLIGSVDAVICDPPYGTTACKWDALIPNEKLWPLLNTKCRADGAMAMTASQPFTSVLVCSNIGQFRYDWTWRKPKGTGHLNAKKMPMRDKEDIVVFSREPHRYFPVMTAGKAYKAKPGKSKANGEDCYGDYADVREDNAGTRYPKQVIEFGIVERDKLHPTQKPVDLMKFLVETYTKPGDTVLDFAMGSGSTGVACAETGRRFIGIEKDAAFFEIAKGRVTTAYYGELLV